MEFIRRSVGVMSRAIKEYPKISCVILSIPFAHYGLLVRADRRLRSRILSKLEEGSCPSAIPPLEEVIGRPNVEEMVTQLVLPPAVQAKATTEQAATKEQVAKLKHFGVVLGPSGTGKTTIVRRLCARYRHGFIYHEVFDPRSLTDDLAKAVGMVTEPKNLVDLLLAYVSHNYRQYHVLPDDNDKDKGLAGLGVSYVLDEIAKAGKRFKSRHGSIPVLILDGVDLIAKFNPDAFIVLVDRAKFLANEGTLRLVLVSSEGSVMPLIGKTSSISRRAPVVEVVDIADEEAEAFLSTVVPKDLAKGITTLVGGRFVHLLQAMVIYASLPENTKRSSSMALDKIRDDMFAQIVKTRMTQVLDESVDIRSMGKMIVDHILCDGYVDSSNFATDNNLNTYLIQTNKPKLFRFVEVRSIQEEQFVSREALTRGIILNSSVDRDDLVATHNAIVDREGDLVNVGDYLAYQSCDEVHFCLTPSQPHSCAHEKGFGQRVVLTCP